MGILGLGKKAKAVVPPSRYEAAVSFAEERLLVPAKEAAASAWDAVPAEVRARAQAFVASRAGVALAVALLVVMLAAWQLWSLQRSAKATKDVADDDSVEQSYKEFLTTLNDCGSSVDSAVTDDAVQSTATPTSSPPNTPLRKPVSLKKQLSSKIGNFRRISSNASLASSTTAGSMRSFVSKSLKHLK